MGGAATAVAVVVTATAVAVPLEDGTPGDAASPGSEGRLVGAVFTVLHGERGIFQRRGHLSMVTTPQGAEFHLVRGLSWIAGRSVDVDTLEVVIDSWLLREMPVRIPLDSHRMHRGESLTISFPDRRILAIT